MDKNNLYQRKKGGSWYYKFQYRTIERHASSRKKDFTQAFKVALAVWDELVEEVDGEGSFVTIGDALDAWLKSKIDEGLADSSIESYGCHVKRLKGDAYYYVNKIKHNAIGLDPLMKLHKLDNQAIETMRSGWAKEGIELSTRDALITAISGTLKLNRRMGKRVPELSMKEFRYKFNNIKKRYLRTYEESALLDYLSTQKNMINHDYCILMLDTGMRPISEAACLPWRKVDFKSGKITIERTKTVKSGVATTVVDITKRVRAMLERRWNNPSRDPSNDYVFPSQDGTTYFAGNGTWCSRAVKELGFNSESIVCIEKGKITPMTMRRTFCCRLLKSGLSLKKVSVLMGHQSTAITEARYGWVVDEDGNTAAADLLDGYSD